MFVEGTMERRCVHREKYDAKYSSAISRHTAVLILDRMDLDITDLSHWISRSL